MGLFLSAAEAWNTLLTTSYCLQIGHKGKLRQILLRFRLVDFYHLSGIHYAKDIDFKRHRNEYQGAKLVPALLSGVLDDSLIEKSVNWPKISGRLNSVLQLEEILDSEFNIYTFAPDRLPFPSKINAAYLLYSEKINDGVFLFFDQDADVYYCKSLFHDDIHDYKANQTQWTVLTKTKRFGDHEELQYKHPHYKELHGQIIDH